MSFSFRVSGNAEFVKAMRSDLKLMPDDIRALKERYGFGTLKKLLIACEVLDVYDEPLANDTFRTLYRVRRGT